MKKNAGGKFRVDQKVKNNCLEHRSREGVFLCFANDIKAQEDVKVCDNCISNIKEIQINETRISINPKIQALLDSSTIRLLDKSTTNSSHKSSKITSFDLTSMTYCYGNGSLSQVNGIQVVLRQDNLNEFAALLSQLVCLQEIDISEDEHDPVDESTFASLCSLMSSINNISNIQLPLFQNPDIKQKQFALLAVKHLEEIPLKKFHLNFRSNSILKGESLLELSKVILENNHNQIEDFKLDLQNNRVIGYGLSEISSVLQRCKSLKKLHLNFHNNISFSDQSLLDLAAALEEKDEITELYVNLHKNDNFSDNSFGKFATSVSGFLQTKKLNLDFHHNTTITDKGFYSLTSGMSRMKQLVEVQLNFAANTLITDESLINMSKILVTKGDITTLSLQFTNCNQISSQSLTDIGTTVGSIRNLLHLHLDFAKSTLFSEESVISLVSGIKKQAGLKSIYLNLRSNNACGENSMKEMVACFKTTKSLRQFSVYLSNGYYSDINDFLSRFPDNSEQHAEENEAQD